MTFDGLMLALPIAWVAACLYLYWNWNASGRPGDSFRAWVKEQADSAGDYPVEGYIPSLVASLAAVAALAWALS